LVCFVCVLFDGFIIALVNPLNHQQCIAFLMLKQHCLTSVSIILKKDLKNDRPGGI